MGAIMENTVQKYKPENLIVLQLTDDGNLEIVNFDINRLPLNVTGIDYSKGHYSVTIPGIPINPSRRPNIGERADFHWTWHKKGVIGIYDGNDKIHQQKIAMHAVQILLRK